MPPANWWLFCLTFNVLQINMIFVTTGALASVISVLQGESSSIQNGVRHLQATSIPTQGLQFQHPIIQVKS